jgi:K+-transporting ATPase ATPase C chain
VNSPHGHSDPASAAQPVCAHAARLVPEARLARQTHTVILSVLALTLLTGVVFPLLLLGVSRLLFPGQASGSLLRVRGAVVGAGPIGQSFTRPEWFHPRPSAAGVGYDATTSGGTNLAPGNPRLMNGSPDMQGIRELAADYRRENGLAPDSPIPIDAVTRSGSGLDPDISPANAYLQVARVARTRKLDESQVRRLVADHIVPPQLGFLGEPHVRVLELNLRLELLQQRTATAHASAR